MKAVGTKDEGKPVVGQASSDIPALKPYWGKPAVRNFRGGDGNVGIIRSPVRAIALPDYFLTRDLGLRGESAARGFSCRPTGVRKMW